MSGEYKMNQFDQFLTDTHTVDGLIQVDDSVNSLEETVEQFKQHAQMDYDDFTTQLIESGLCKALMIAIVHFKDIKHPMVTTIFSQLESLHGRNVGEEVINKLNCR